MGNHLTLSEIEEAEVQPKEEPTTLKDNILYEIKNSVASLVMIKSSTDTFIHITTPAVFLSREICELQRIARKFGVDYSITSEGEFRFDLQDTLEEEY